MSRGPESEGVTRWLCSKYLRRESWQQANRPIWLDRMKQEVLQGSEHRHGWTCSLPRMGGYPYSCQKGCSSQFLVILLEVGGAYYWMWIKGNGAVAAEEDGWEWWLGWGRKSLIVNLGQSYVWLSPSLFADWAPTNRYPLAGQCISVKLWVYLGPLRVLVSCSPPANLSIVVWPGWILELLLWFTTSSWQELGCGA